MGAPPGLEDFFEEVAITSPVSPPSEWSSGVLEATKLFERVHVEKVFRLFNQIGQSCDEDV
jgi:hypothetical protein